jgi:hypothetical protein
VADGGQSVILNQVANGLAIRMAVLYLVGTFARGAVESRPESSGPQAAAPPSGSGTSPKGIGS